MSVIVCHACDLAHRADGIVPAARVRCVRCRAELYRTNAAGVDTPLALAFAALVLFIIANAYPLVAFKVNGTTRLATLTGAALGLYDQGYATLGLLVIFTAVLVPLTQILAFLYVLVPVRLGFRAPGQETLFRVLAALRPWGMSEVFVLGAIVALVKLSSEAEVAPRIALVAYGLLMFMLAAMASVTPTEQFWQWISRGRR
ncbi:MAG: paraquat-inducible protein A [Steroidobacteraceae bacterium]